MQGGGSGSFHCSIITLRKSCWIFCQMLAAIVIAQVKLRQRLRQVQRDSIPDSSPVIFARNAHRGSRGWWEGVREEDHHILPSTKETLGETTGDESDSIGYVNQWRLNSGLLLLLVQFYQKEVKFLRIRKEQTDDLQFSYRWCNFLLCSGKLSFKSVKETSEIGVQVYY